MGLDMGFKRLNFFRRTKKRKYNKPVAVVVNSETPNGYGVIVNLGREGIFALSVDSNSKNVTFLSRYAQKVLCPDYTISEDNFINFLMNLGKCLSPKPVLFVTGDLKVLAVLRHREKLEQYFHIPMSSLDIVEKLVNKVVFYRMLDKFNIPHAKTYVPDNLSEVKMISQDLEYPYIIKPVQSSAFTNLFGNKCLRADSGKELVELYKKAVVEEDTLIIQQELAGTERYLVYMYLNRDSKPLAVCCCKKIRILPIDYGNACVCKTVWEPDVVNLGLNLLQKIGYYGLAEAEIQRDERDGKLKLVEINARSTTETRLTARCGMNMEYIAYRDVLGLKINKIHPTKLDVIWIEILRDIQSIFSREGYLAQKKITITQWLQSLRGEREYAFLSWDDPLPFIVLLFRFFRTYGLKKKNLLVFHHIFEFIFSNFRPVQLHLKPEKIRSFKKRVDFFLHL
jgi:D-aspartate ligase